VWRVRRRSLSVLDRQLTPGRALSSCSGRLHAAWSQHARHPTEENLAKNPVDRGSGGPAGGATRSRLATIAGLGPGCPPDSPFDDERVDVDSLHVAGGSPRLLRLRTRRVAQYRPSRHGGVPLYEEWETSFPPLVPSEGLHVPKTEVKRQIKALEALGYVGGD